MSAVLVRRYVVDGRRIVVRVVDVLPRPPKIGGEVKLLGFVPFSPRFYRRGELLALLRARGVPLS